MKYYIVYRPDFTWYLLCCGIGEFPFEGNVFFDEISEEEFNQHIDYICGFNDSGAKK